jgi:CRISPR-associated protein Cas6
MHHQATPYVDAAFPARGDTIPLDHAYPLLGALSRILPALHDAPHWGVHPVLGERRGPGVLALTSRSHVKLRVPASDVGQLLPLAQQTLELDGARIRLGVPRLLPLMPTPYLKARIVTIKGFADDANAFVLAMRRQIASIPGLCQDPERVEVQLGPRRVLRARQHTVVGWAVALTGLEADASLAVQVNGLGGRRHMGAGIFVPPPRAA